MVTTPLVPASELIHLSGISWQTYETLLDELTDRRCRLTFNRGSLEIMAPSPEHELNKKVLGRFLETLAEEFEVDIYPLGSMTLKRPELSGAEPDECFYFRNIDAVRGKKRLDLGQDPVPDLILEIDLTSSSVNRLKVYGEMGVAEVWIYNGSSLVIMQLQSESYVTALRSQFFVGVDISEIVVFLRQADSVDYLTLVKLFRTWIKSQVQIG